MFTQTVASNLAQTVRKRVLGSDLLDLLTGPHGVDRYTELVAPTWTLGEARAKVIDVRRTTPRSVTLTLDSQRGLHVRPHRQSRPVRQPHRRDRRSPAHSLLFAGQRRRQHQPRADDRSPRRRAGLELPVRAGPSRHGGRPDRRRRRLRVAGAAAATDPVRLRRKRHHAGDGDAAHAGRRGPPRARSRSCTTPARRGGVLPRRAGRRCPAFACCTATRARDAGDLVGRFGPRIWPPRCPHPMRCSSAGQRLWSRPSGNTARTCTPRASCRRSSSRRPIRRADESASPTAGSTSSTTVARCWNRPSRPA